MATNREYVFELASHAKTTPTGGLCMAPHTGHGTITWVVGHKTGQMRHETPYSESVLFRAVFRT